MSVLTIPKPAEEAEWLLVRHGYANASDAAVYMGCHPYKSLADLAVEKLAESPTSLSSRAMTRGHMLEAAVADWWAAEHGVTVYEPDVLYRKGRLLATLDRRIVGTDTEALEVKTTKHVVSDVMDYWWWQAQAQALCAELDTVHFAVLDGTMDLRTFKVQRDADACEQLEAAVEHFWSYVDLGMTPEGVQLGASHIASMFPLPDPESFVDLDDDGLQTALAYAQARDARLAAEKAEDAARDALARILLDCAEARYDGRSLCTWKASKPTQRLDTKALAEAEPELVAKFTRPVPGARRLVVKALPA